MTTPERCPVCDRPRAECARLLAFPWATPADARAAEDPTSALATTVAECEENAVDWRARAVAAEQEIATARDLAAVNALQREVAVARQLLSDARHWATPTEHASTETVRAAKAYRDRVDGFLARTLDYDELQAFAAWLESRNAEARANRVHVVGSLVDQRILGRIEGEEAAAAIARSGSWRRR